MERCLDQLQVYLEADVAECHLLVHSFSPLNSELCHPRDAIHTEEECRTFFEDSRRLFYNLHLDLPRRRESSLVKELSNFIRFHTNKSRARHCCNKNFAREFYSEAILSFVEHACKYPDRSKGALKWFLKCKEFNIELRLQPTYFTDNFVECITHSEITDCEFVRDCFENLDFETWLLSHKQPEKVENLLFQLCKAERKMGPSSLGSEFKEFFFVAYKYSGSALKILDAPAFDGSSPFYRRVKSLFIQNLPEVRTSVRRNALLNHLMFLRKCAWIDRPFATEALRLVWASIPDAFLNQEEIAAACARLDSFGREWVEKFYSEAVGGLESKLQPRSLRHLSITSIRQRLAQSNDWLPTAISKTGLPLKLQSYLNLEK